MTSSGARRSQWAVFDRCFALLLRLMREPATSDELLGIVLAKAEEEGERLSRNAAIRRFEEDRVRLRTHFGCHIECDRSGNIYSLVGMGRPLIDLPPDALRGLAFLQATFSGHDVPMSAEVRALIDRLVMVLPAKTRRDLTRERGLLELDLGQRDEDQISDAVWESVRIACSERRQLEIEYRSPQQSDDIPRVNLVEPYRYYFDTVRCHYYLEGYWIESRGPYGVWPQNRIQTFRLGRIEKARLLPNHFPSGQRRIPKDELVYELAPAVARLGVTRHFPDSQILPQPDGSAVVRTLSANLFVDLRTLLHYGPSCRVIGGEKAVEAMKLLVKSIAARYES